MNNKKNVSGGGLGFGSVIGIVFVILKLVGVIDWSWWWVLSPFWISLVLVVLGALGLYCYYKWDEKRSKNRWK